jgi:hypothetical protein
MGFVMREILRNTEARPIFYRALGPNRTCLEDTPPSLHNLTNRKTQYHRLLSPMAVGLADLADWMELGFTVFWLQPNGEVIRRAPDIPTAITFLVCSL